MTITALSEDTVRLLGSHTVITTPVDLVKELLDNAIDAKATSVNVLVSPNFVDKIEVRDNGHGIHAYDYSALGRAGHTSKTTSFGDVSTLGGTALGFRGQALASANNIGTVTVTTRTAEDPTAVALKLSPGVGGVDDQRLVSAPTGTTVSVTSLYTRLPVREQVAVKDASKNLIRIRQMLHAYALARPQVRLCFRILGESNKHTFSYSPRTQADVKEAVIQVFGAEVMSQCLIRTILSDAGSEYGEVTRATERFSIEAVLPKLDADQSIISKGPFFSIDSRPVSAQRGTVKKLLASFRAYFSRFLETTYGEKAFRNTFVCVNIRCSTGSYDPNVEPSKDVVLFANESQVTQLFERLCSEIYSRKDSFGPFVTFQKRQLPQGAQARTPPPSSDSPRPYKPTLPAPDEVPQDSSTRLQQTPLPSSSSPVRGLPTRYAPQRLPLPTRIDGRGFTVDMSADPDMSSDEEAEMMACGLRQQEIHLQGEEEEEEDEDSMEALNPWSIAKMNAAGRQVVNPEPLSVQQPQHPGQIQEQSGFATPNEGSKGLAVFRTFGEAAADLDVLRAAQLGIVPTRHQHLELPYVHHLLDHGNTTSPVSHDALKPNERPKMSNIRQSRPTLRRPRDMHSAGMFPNERIEDVERDGFVQKRQTRQALGGRFGGSQDKQKGQMQRQMNNVPSKSNPPFRTPKRLSIRDSSSTSNHGNAHNHVAAWMNTQCLITKGLGSGTTDIGAVQATLTSSEQRGDENWVDGDSRKYLMKRQRSQAEHRRRGRQPLKRVKTDRLPLEITPEKQGVHDLELTVVPNTERLAYDLEIMAEYNTFCHSFYTEIELSNHMSIDDAVEVEARLKDLVSAWAEKTIGERTEVNFDLRSRVKGKDVAV